MIKSISLKNWRSHESTEIQFGKGTNLLVGIMGSGKSSVVDALCFAFYGDFPALQHGKAVLKDVIRFGGSEAEVKLDFALGEENYSVSRVVSQKGSDAFLYKNSRLIDKSPKAVTRYLEDLLKVDYDLFTRAVYSVQNRMDYFLTLDPASRKKEIDRLLGLDRFEKARANATTLANRVKELRETLAKGYSPERLEALQKKKEELGEQHASLLSKISSLSSSLSSLSEKLKAKDAEHSSLATLRAEHRRLSDERERAAALVSKLQSELAKIPPEALEEKQLSGKKAQLAAVMKESEGCRLKLRAAADEASSLSGSLGMLESKLKAEQARLERTRALEKELSSLLGAGTLASLAEEQAALRKKTGETRSGLGAAECALAEIKDSLSSLKEGMAKCPVCDSQLTHDKVDALRSSRKSSLGEAEKKLSGLKTDLISLEKKDGELASKVRKAESLSASISELSKSAAPAGLEAEIEKARKLLAGKAEERKALETEYSSLEPKLARLRDESLSLEQALSKKAELASLQASLSKLEQSLSQMKFDEKTFEQARSELEQLRLSHAREGAELEAKKRELAYIGEGMRGIEDELGRAAGLRGEAEYYAKKEEDLIIYKNCISETQAAMRSELIEAINSAMAEIWPVIYPYSDYKKIRLSADSKDYFFELWREPEGWHPLEAIASGGERACLCLAMRIAFAMVLTPNLSWLILDEPTHNLDEEAVRTLAETLEQKIPSIVDQTFIITHDASLADSEFASVYRFGRDKAGGEASAVEKLS